MQRRRENGQDRKQDSSHRGHSFSGHWHGFSPVPRGMYGVVAVQATGVRGSSRTWQSAFLWAHISAYFARPERRPILRAMVFESGNSRLRMERNWPMREPNANEVLIRVHACGVCRTDL